MLVTLVLLYMTNNTWEWIMSVTQIDIDDDALERAMALVPCEDQEGSGQPRSEVLRREAGTRGAHRPHFERAREWGAVEDAERLHRAEKESR